MKLEIIAPPGNLKYFEKQFYSLPKECVLRPHTALAPRCPQTLEMYKDVPVDVDEENYANLKLLVSDDTGKYVRNAVVTITATDEQQDFTINGTGGVTNIYDENGKKSVVPSYEFDYYFMSAGEHTITFAVNDVKESITLTAIEDPRPRKSI